MSFKITVLGSNSALPSQERFCSAHVVNIHERFFLIDCGEGTQIQMRKFKIKYAQINHIFISHLHGDHFFGIFGLISSYTMLGRKNDLHIYSPGHLEKKIFSIIKKKEVGYTLFFHRIETSKIFPLYETKSLIISCFPLKHRIETYGFLFQEKARARNLKKECVDEFQLGIKDILNIKDGKDHIGELGLIKNSDLTYPPFKARSYAYCSDTAYDERLPQILHDIDILYHEATFAQDLKETAAITQHSTGEEAATIARSVGAGKLLLGHFSTRYKTAERILLEARHIFENTVVVNDGDIFEIPLERVKE
jgi:ribonuclease Z